jgi:hypothetical protein
MAAATAYIRVLRHAAAAESLTAFAFQDSSKKTPEWSPESDLANVLYNLDAARHEYRCAAQVLEPFSQSSDSTTRAFVIETRGVFLFHAGWIRDVTADLKRRASGNSQTLVREAERLADLHRRRDNLTKLISLNSVGLSYVLLEKQASDTMRFALTAEQRDSLVAELEQLVPGSTADVPAVANLLIAWLKQREPVR